VNNRLIILSCPQGFFFDQTKGFCNLEKQVRCEFSSTTTTASTGFTSSLNPTTIEPITTSASLTPTSPSTTSIAITKKPLCSPVPADLGD
jgi:hypothetical protein